MSSKVYLCFDHGEKRIGVAVGQSVSATASPLETISAKHGKPDWKAISRIIKQWDPHEFVVGKPLTMQGDRQDATDAAERFARQLQGRYLLPLHFADERLSTHEAKHRLKDSYKLDHHAAQIILESWLSDKPVRESDVTMQDS
ncbi:MAG: putative Holliday junction resolvase [Gammaproteobacteria bacterium]